MSFLLYANSNSHQILFATNPAVLFRHYTDIRR